MNHLFRSLLVLVVIVVASAPAAVAQTDEDLAQRVKRLAAGQDPAAARIEMGLSYLEELKAHPDAALELDVEIVVAQALGRLERFRDALPHLEAAVALARETHDDLKLVLCLWETTLISFRLGEAEITQTAATECMDVAKSIDRLDFLWRASNILGLSQERTGDHGAAFESFARGLEAAEALNDRSAISSVLSNIGMTRMNLGDYDEAIGIYLRALEMQEELGERRGISSTLANLGDVHFLIGDYDAALEYHQDALLIRKELGIESELARSMHSMGAIHYGREEYELALEKFEQALAIRRRLDMAPEQAESLMGLAVVYAALDRDEEALASIRSSEEIAEKRKLKGRFQAVYENLATVYEEQGMLAEAIEAMREAVSLEREARTLENTQNFARLNAEYGAREKEQQIAMLEQETEIQNLNLERQGLVRNVLLVGSVLLAAIAFVGWYAWAVLRRTHRALADTNAQLTQANAELVAAAHWIKSHEGILPICSCCKNIRDDTGEWHGLESYISHHSEAEFSHGICPSCVEERYPEFKSPTPSR